MYALILIGLAVSFNFLIIVKKYKDHRWLNATLDALLLMIICIVFSGSFNALVVGTIGSAIISIYLWFSPITLASFLPQLEEDDYDDYD